MGNPLPKLNQANIVLIDAQAKQENPVIEEVKTQPVI
jgi:hypothetical protein